MADKFSENIKSRLNGDLLEPNHFTRRMFRCWLDGSYLGEQHYKANVKFLTDLKEQAFKFGHGKHLDKKVRSFVIGQFVQYIAHEVGECSTSYAHRVINETIDADTLEKLNTELIDDAWDLVADFGYSNERMKDSYALQ